MLKFRDEVFLCIFPDFILDVICVVTGFTAIASIYRSVMPSTLTLTCVRSAESSAIPGLRSSTVCAGRRTTNLSESIHSHSFSKDR